MHLLSIIFILVILGGWLFIAGRFLWSAKKEKGGKRWLQAAGAVFASIGAIGFFGAGLSASGGLNWLPSSFEWPVGSARGVVFTEDNFFVVPHTPSNRVQVYDRDWRFVRGWYVDAGGGTFTLRTSGSNQVEVITSRGQWHYTFDLQGKLLSKEHYTSGTYGSFRGQGESHTVPTAPWLWVFTSPGYSWLAAAAGMGLLAAANKFFRKQMPRPN